MMRITNVTAHGTVEFPIRSTSKLTERLLQYRAGVFSGDRRPRALAPVSPLGSQGVHHCAAPRSMEALSLG